MELLILKNKNMNKLIDIIKTDGEPDIITNNINAENLINWGELSRMLSGSRMIIRKNKVPKMHQPVIDELLSAIDCILSKAGSARHFI